MHPTLTEILSTQRCPTSFPGIRVSVPSEHLGSHSCWSSQFSPSPTCPPILSVDWQSIRDGACFRAACPRACPGSYPVSEGRRGPQAQLFHCTSDGPLQLQRARAGGGGVPLLGLHQSSTFKSIFHSFIVAVPHSMQDPSQFPDQGSNPCPPAVDAGSPNHWTSGNSQGFASPSTRPAPLPCCAQADCSPPAPPDPSPPPRPGPQAPDRKPATKCPQWVGLGLANMFSF